MGGARVREEDEAKRSLRYTGAAIGKRVEIRRQSTHYKVPGSARPVRRSAREGTAVKNRKQGVG